MCACFYVFTYLLSPSPSLSLSLCIYINIYIYISMYIYLYVCVCFVTILPGLSFLLKTKILKVTYMNALKAIWATDIIIGRLSFIYSLENLEETRTSIVMDNESLAAIWPMLRSTAEAPGFACLRPHVWWVPPCLWLRQQRPLAQDHPGPLGKNWTKWRVRLEQQGFNF